MLSSLFIPSEYTHTSSRTVTGAMTQDCDVLVVGAGPVGTALALELALHHVSFRIVDQRPVRNDKSRALVVQPRTLELLNRHGAADIIVRRGRILHGGATYINNQLIASTDMDDLDPADTEFSRPLNVSQVLTETFLEECLSKYDVRVERPVTASGIVQDDSGVTVTLELPDGKTETIRSKYVVGCDGAHSVVRHASEKMTFPGATYPQEFVLCDTHLRDTVLPMDRTSIYLDDKGALAILPMDDDVVRVIVSRRAVPVASQDVPTLDQIQAYFDSMTPPGAGTLADSTWLTCFRLHHRCVNQYRDGRLFVAGDAAHIHSPAGGLGMNTGIQDAINLGWKLARALALQSHQPPKPSSPTPTATAAAATAAAAADALLDTYDLERRPVGQAILRGTDRLFTLISAPNPWTVPLRNLVMGHVLPRVGRWHLFRFTSQFGVNYRGRTRLVGDGWGRRGGRLLFPGGWWGGGGSVGGGGLVRGGDRMLDGMLLAGGSSPGETRETRLQKVLVGAPHHLVLFAGGGKRGVAAVAELERAAERAVAACKMEVRVHYIVAAAAGAEGRAAVEREEWYADAEGKLHAKFGFAKGPGYVLVRPDGYVAHIGPLARLDRFVAFLDGYLVSAVVTPPRPRLSFVSPAVVWAVVAAGIVFKLWGQIARQV